MEQAEQRKRNWYLIDLKSGNYGRVLSKAATILMGKHRADYSANLDTGDYVVLINCDHINLTGNKIDQRVYYHHTGYLGGIKKKEIKDFIKEDSTQLVRKSLSGMLPKNKLQKPRIFRLKTYKDAEHPHQNIKFEVLK